MPEYPSPSICPALFVRWCTAQRQRALDPSGGPNQQDIAQATAHFLSGGWKDPGLEVASAQRSLAERDQAAIAHAALLLERRLEEALSRTDRQEVLRGLRGAMLWASERLTAMHLAGEAKEVIAVAAGRAAEILCNARVAADVNYAASSMAVGGDALAPALTAAVISVRQGAEEAHAAEHLRRHRLGEGALLPPRQLATLAEAFRATMREARAELAEPLLAHPAALAEALPTDAADGQPVPIDLRRLVGSLTPEVDGGDDYLRADGAHALLQTLRATLRRRGRDIAASPRALLDAQKDALAHLDRIAHEEQVAIESLQPLLREIDREIKIQARFKNTGPLVAPLPDQTHPLTARGLYIHEAADKGVPLSVIIAGLCDGRDTSYGPTERAFLERVAFAATRAMSERSVAGVFGADGLTRGERGTISLIEAELRAGAGLNDLELASEGARLLREATVVGEVAEKRWGVLKGAVDRVIDHIRAGEEVAVLTCVLAAEREIPPDILRDYHQLPHAARVLGGSEPRALMEALTRNGQNLADLEGETRERWMAYRRGAGGNRDVRAIPLAAKSDEAKLAGMDPLQLTGQRSETRQPGRGHAQRSPRGS
jgi:hypothetical protein